MLGFIAFVLSVSVVIGCSFFEVSSSAIFGSVSVGISKYEMFTINVKDFDYYTDLTADDFSIFSVGCSKFPGKTPPINYEDFNLNNYDFLKINPQQVAYTVTSGGGFKSAKAFGAITAFVAILTVISCFSMMFLKLPRWAFKTLSGCYFFCFFTQLLTFLVLNNDACNGKINSDVKANLDFDLGIYCDLSNDSYIAIVASIFYLSLGVLILVCPTPKVRIISKTNCGNVKCCECCEEPNDESEDRPDKIAPLPEKHKNVRTYYYNPQTIPPGSIKKSKKHHSDGSVVIREEWMNPDGSKSVTHTTIPPIPNDDDASIEV